MVPRPLCHRKGWIEHIRSFQWKINLGWFFHFLNSSFPAAAILLAPLVLWFRGSQIDEFRAAGCVFLGLAFAIAFALWKSWPKFFDFGSAQAELEHLLRLDNRLTAAQIGIAPWPKPPASFPGICRWKWEKIAPVPLISLLIVLLAATLPVTPASIEEQTAWTKPPALQKLETWTETLRQAELVREDALQKVEQQVQDLADKQPIEWYSHSSLEAADTLLLRTRDSLQELAAGLDAARVNLDAASERRPLTEQESAKCADNFSALLQAMETNMLPLNERTLGKLKSIDPKSMRNLSQRELQELSECLKKNAKTCRECLGADGIAGLGNYPVAVPVESGQGDIQRGPGAAPMALAQSESKTKSERIEGASSFDPKRAAFGKKFGESVGAHEVDRRELIIQNAGEISSIGAGGEAIWTQNLAPEEKAIIEKIYR